MESFTLRDQKSMINLTQFEATIWAKHNTQHLGIQKMENYDFVLKGANVKIPKKTTYNEIKSNKCNQCDYASSRADHLRTQRRKVE